MPPQSRRHGSGRWRMRWGRAARFSPRCCRTCFIAGVRIPRISPPSWSAKPTPSCIGSGRSCRLRHAVPRSITCDSMPIHRWRRGHSFNPCCPTCRISSPVINLGLCLIRSPARCRSLTASRMVGAWKIPASPRSSPIRTSTVSSPSSIHQCRYSRRHTVSRASMVGFCPTRLLSLTTAFHRCSVISLMARADRAKPKATCPTAAARPRGIRCMLTTRSSSKPPSQRFCRDFGARAAMGAM